MLSKLSRTAKVAIVCGAAALVVILATTLGVTLSPSRRNSNTSSSNLGTSSTNSDTTVGDEASDTTSGSGSEAGPWSVPCPCFNEEDLDIAVAEITSNTAGFVFQSEQTCVGGNFNGIRYSQDVGGALYALGYGVALEGQISCEDADTMRDISQQQAESCSLLLDAKCDEHAVTLEAAASTEVDVSGEDAPATCRCFNSGSLDSLAAVVASVLEGSLTLNNGSCDSTSANMSISYSIQGDYPEIYAWGAASFQGELSCQLDDILMTLKLQNEWDGCKAIVDNACAQIAE